MKTRNDFEGVSTASSQAVTRLNGKSVNALDMQVVQLEILNALVQACCGIGLELRRMNDRAT